MEVANRTYLITQTRNVEFSLPRHPQCPGQAPLTLVVRSKKVEPHNASLPRSVGGLREVVSAGLQGCSFPKISHRWEHREILLATRREAAGVGSAAAAGTWTLTLLMPGHIARPIFRVVDASTPPRHTGLFSQAQNVSCRTNVHHWAGVRDPFRIRSNCIISSAGRSLLGRWPGGLRAE
jgi:hypothetical protein